MASVRTAVFATALLLAAPASPADFAANVGTRYYEIAGSTAIGLYRSIGDRGPAVGGIRAIALTSWDLKWRRNYQPDGSACSLKSARPFLTITTTLPKPIERLDAKVAADWQAFISGITAHEAVHARDIVKMVDDIIAATVGLRIENDADCVAIRAEVLKRVDAANEAYKAKSRAFDQTEMRGGGAVHRLILAFVNG